MITDNDIKNKLLTKSNTINSKAINKLTIEEINYINNRYNDSLSFKESVKRIILNINIHPTCPICGKPVLFVGKTNSLWTNTCLDKKCVNTYRLQHIQQTNMEKYGCVCAFQHDNVKEKCKQTKLKRYGNEYWSNPEKTSNTWNQKTEEELNNIKSKTIQTCLKKYGVTNAGGTPESIKKIKHTKLIHYGNENYVNIEKQKQTCLERYGVERYQQTNEFKQLISKKLSSETCINKRKQTTFERYFSYTYNNSEKHKQTCLSYYNVPYYNNQEKRFQTMKQNNSFNVSQPENECYELLKEKYPDIIRQYRDERYPFNCDFYIPSIDLFIEYQGTWTHGGKPFEGTDEDLNKMYLWKNKNTEYYNNAIYTWTELDVLKRNIAKENHLNYIEIWNIEEIKNNFVL